MLKHKGLDENPLTQNVVLMSLGDAVTARLLRFQALVLDEVPPI